MKKQKPLFRQNIIDVIQMAGDFEYKFCEYEYIEPKDILNELNFDQTDFYELDSTLQNTLQQNPDIRWYGHPLRFNGQVTGEGTIMQNPEGDIVYFFRENKLPNGKTDYACSRLTDAKNAYHINPIGHACDSAELIHNVAFFEIINEQNENSRHHTSNEIIKIPCVEELECLVV